MKVYMAAQLTQYLNLIKLLESKQFMRTVAGTSGAHQSEVPNEVWDAVTESRNFVIHGEMTEQHGSELLETPVQIDLPFPTTAFEVPDAALLANSSFAIYCLIVKEIAPRTYTFYASTQQRGGSVVVCEINKHDEKRYEFVSRVVTKLLEKISRDDIGEEKVNVRLRLGTGDNRRLHRIKEVVHVAPKKLIKNAPENLKQVNWSHRFEVRGHWREISGIGKDRDGARNVEGYTWVRNYTRGDESLPLLKKARIVKSENKVLEL